MDEIQKLKAQRDGLAHYIFEQNDGALYKSHCRRHMEAGNCPYHNKPSDTDRAAGLCVPCILELIGDGAAKPTDPFFFLLAEYHVLVTYIVIGGMAGTGRVQSVKDGNIAFMVKNKTQRYALRDIDVIVPREVLRWSGGELAPATWRDKPAEQLPEEQPTNGFGRITAGLRSIGIQPFTKGATELEIAIRLAMEDPTYLERMKSLYSAVADEIGEPESTASSRMRKATKTAKRNKRNVENCSDFYSLLLGERANVKVFLRAFLHFMNHTNFFDKCFSD